MQRIYTLDVILSSILSYFIYVYSVIFANNQSK